MQPAADPARPPGVGHEADMGLRPRWLRRLAIGLYLAAAACVLLASTSPTLGGWWFEVPLSLVLAAYCLTYAWGLARARRADPSPTDPRPYVLAFADEPVPENPLSAEYDAAVLVTLALHAACGLMAGLELVFEMLTREPSSSVPILAGFGIEAGAIGLLVGWIPALALVSSSRNGGWVALAGVLGPILVFTLALPRFLGDFART